MHKDKRKVYESYDKIADWFDNTRSRDLMEEPYLEALTKDLQENAHILDLGCGTGEPLLRFLSKSNYKITGLDASKTMLDKAKNRFPNITFIHKDMRDINFNVRFDAIIAWHSFFHLPPDDQRDMFEVFSRHMKQGSLLLFTSGSKEGECWNDNNGEALYHASLNTNTYNQLLKENNFHIINYIEDDPNCGHATIWLVRYQP